MTRERAAIHGTRRSASARNRVGLARSAQPVGAVVWLLVSLMRRYIDRARCSAATRRSTAEQLAGRWRR